MILLPNGCNCSDLTVNPKNWNTNKRVTIRKPWYIQYYFRDPLLKDKYPKGKLVIVKGMNHLKDVESRVEATKVILENELYMLKVQGYNPITGKMNGPDIDVTYEIHPETLFPEAIDLAYEKSNVGEKTRREMKTIKKYFLDAMADLKLEDLKIKDVKRKHVRAILELQSDKNNYSPNRFNSARSYVSIFFKTLLGFDAIEANPVNGIQKKKTVKKIRKSLTPEELEIVKAHLKENYYTFYRYVQIFFYSGCRSSELMQVKRSDVDLDSQIFKVTVKKGPHYYEEYRAINDHALEIWAEACEGAPDNHYIFSKKLKHGPVAIDEWQVYKRWRVHVKQKLGIEADFYSLKHLHTTKIIDHYNTDLAAAINGHKSDKMNAKHYDLLRKERLLEQAKKANVKL